MIDCPIVGIRNAIAIAIETGNFDALFTDSPKFYGSEHLVNCIRCKTNRGYCEDPVTVVCGHDPDNEVILHNKSALVV